MYKNIAIFDFLYISLLYFSSYFLISKMLMLDCCLHCKIIHIFNQSIKYLQMKKMLSANIKIIKAFIYAYFM